MRLLFITEFPYNNVKNANIGHTLFELNCNFHFQASYKKDIDIWSMSKVVDKLTNELRELTIVCRNNLRNAQKLQKQYYDKYAKPKSYSPGNKVLLNSKYIEI